jgi:hypothetical protein
MTRLALLAAALAAAPVLAHATEADPRWGIYGQLAAGGAWELKLSSGDTAIARYTWTRPGQELRVEHRLQGTPYVTVETVTLGPPGKLVISTQENDRDKPTRSEVVLHPNGTAVETFVGRTGNRERATYGPVDKDRYLTRTESEIGGVWREIWSSEATRLP